MISDSHSCWWEGLSGRINKFILMKRLQAGIRLMSLTVPLRFPRVIRLFRSLVFVRPPACRCSKINKEIKDLGRMEHARPAEIEATNIFSQHPQVSFKAWRQAPECRVFLWVAVDGEGFWPGDLAWLGVKDGTAQSLRLRAGTSAAISTSPAPFTRTAAALFHVDSETRAPPYHNAS